MTKGQMVMKREDLKTNMVRVGIEKVKNVVVKRLKVRWGLKDQYGEGWDSKGQRSRMWW